MESVCRGNSTVGSNPTLSASLPLSFWLGFSLVLSQRRFLSAIPLASAASPAARSQVKPLLMPRRVGRGRNITPLTTLKIAVSAAMPAVSDNTTRTW